MDIRKKLEEIFKDYKGEEVALADETTFDSLGFDSLDKAELLIRLEEELDVNFDDDLQIETVGELVKKLESMMA